MAVASADGFLLFDNSRENSQQKLQQHQDNPGVMDTDTFMLQKVTISIKNSHLALLAHKSSIKVNTLCKM